METRSKFTIVLSAVLLALLVLVRSALPQPVHAAGVWYVKNGGSDSSDCQTPATACASINAALAKPGFVAGDTIRVAVGTYTGTGSEVVRINKDVTLSGGWDAATFTTQSGMATIDGQGARLGVWVAWINNATLENFIVQNGNSIPGIYGGGIVDMESGLGLRNIVIKNNSGGGIGNSNGVVTLRDSVVENNTGDGGIANECYSSQMQIQNTIIRNNQSNTDAGGIRNCGKLMMDTSTVEGNTAGGYLNHGGGIYNKATMTITSSTISGNTMLAGDGAGIYNGGDLALNNSTISDNQGGDGITTWYGSLALNSTTLSHNEGNGITIFGTIIALQNTILSNNGTAGNSDCSIDALRGGSANSLGYNLVKNVGNCLLKFNDLTGLDPQLGSLQNNGGATKTRALAVTSPAVNAGNPTGCSGSIGLLTTDQRGVSRTDRCDVGAYEVQGNLSVAKSVNKSNPMPGDKLTYTISMINRNTISYPSIRMTDTLPSVLSLVDNSITATSGTFGQSSSSVTWAGTITAGMGVTVTYQAMVKLGTLPNLSANNVALINDGTNIYTRTANIKTPIVPIHFPLIGRSPDSGINGIYGRVTFNGQPISYSYVPLELRFYNGSGWTTRATTRTNPDGTYLFLNPPTLTSGQRYYVRYINTGSPLTLASWATRVLTSYTMGDNIAIGDFDIGNIELNAPAPGSLVSLPTTFQWTRRSATPTDSYEFNLIDYTDGNPWWWTAPLGYTGGYTLNSLPAGFSTGTPYAWYVGVYSPDGGYGESFYLYVVGFNNTGNAPRPNAPARARPTVEDLPRPKVAPNR
ncbi:MAG: DUF11 domain-containing protein [Chloroflexi bacterium]|nr:DUF11 domain-containing protein [Chloroflexota bacterium]